MAVSVLPNQGYLDNTLWTVAETPEGEVFDAAYAYSPVNGVAVKGDLIPIDTVEINRLDAEVAATQYARDRKKKYDRLNQDELRFDDQVNGTTTWVDAINAIKAAHPKPAGE
tara:strand:+ start:674 stop:1009 length:336 start_codon:yes stop_codon:yes gene_type:complete